jgi:4'-phosphopantetheinyl transferase
VGVTVWLCETVGEDRAAARALLLAAASEMLGVAPLDIQVAHEVSGRPRLAGAGSDLYVSVSHTRGIAAVALSALDTVGVDVEALRPLPAVELAERWLAPAEAAWVRSREPDGQVGGFLRLWTAKEAIGKALGVGLRGAGLRRPVPLPDRDPARLRAIPGEPAVVVAAPSAPTGFVLAVACGPAAAGTEVEVRELDHARITPLIGQTGSTSAPTSTPGTANPAQRDSSAP